MSNVNWVAFSVFIFFFVVVTVIGFVAARWRKANLNDLTEWVSVDAASVQPSSGFY